MQHLKTLLWKQVTDFTLKVKSSFSLSCLKLLQLYFFYFLMKINVERNINLNCFACLGSYYIDTYTDQGENTI